MVSILWFLLSFNVVEARHYRLRGGGLEGQAVYWSIEMKSRLGRMLEVLGMRFSFRKGSVRLITKW